MRRYQRESEKVTSCVGQTKTSKTSRALQKNFTSLPQKLGDDVLRRTESKLKSKKEDCFMHVENKNRCFQLLKTKEESLSSRLIARWNTHSCIYTSISVHRVCKPAQLGRSTEQREKTETLWSHSLVGGTTVTKLHNFAVSFFSEPEETMVAGEGVLS